MATVTGGWATSYPDYFRLKNYWYVSMVCELPHGKIKTDIQIGTTHAPFENGEKIWVTVDLMKIGQFEVNENNYTYST